MPTKKAAIVAVGLVGAALLFAWVLINNSSQSSMEVTNSTSPKATPPKQAEPVTPDSTVNDLIDEAVADRDDLATEEADELGDLEAGNALVNDLSNVYDENE